MLHGGAGRLRGRGGAQRGGSRTRRADSGQLDFRGSRYGPADSAGVHPHHHAFHRHEVPRLGVRPDQRDGRNRCRYRPVDRRPDHHGYQVAGALVLAGFFAWVRSRKRAGKEALLSTDLFRNRTSNLALVTQNVQWLLLMGSSFVVSAYLQVVRHYNAIQTGVIFTAATVGILLSSLAAGRLAKRFQQRTLIMSGFVTAIAGVLLLVAMVKGNPGAWYFAPGLFLIGLGLGVMLTPSVNVVQSAFPEQLQGEISGVSRSVSNLGSCFGTAIAGTILVSGLADATRSYGIAMIVLAFIGLIGLGATFLLPAAEPAEPRPAPDTATSH